MMFRNSGKLLTTNFSTVWKLLLYFIITALLIVVFVLPVSKPLLNCFESTGFSANAQDFFANFTIGSNISLLFSDLNSLAVIFVESLKLLFASQLFVGIYLCVVILIIIPFLVGLAEFPVGENLYAYMSSQAKFSFSGSYVRNLGRSIKYQLAKILVVLPVNFVICVIVFLALKLATLTGALRIFAPIIITASICILYALKTSIFCCWMPAIVASGYQNPFKNLKLGLKASLRKFFTIFSSTLMIVIICLAINVFFGSFAFLLTIPIGSAMVYVFSMVAFFTSQGMRYYVDLDTIVSPRRLEEADSFSKVKNII